MRAGCFALLVSAVFGIPEGTPEPTEVFLPEKHPLMMSQGVQMAAQSAVVEGRIVTERVTQMKIDADYSAQRLTMQAQVHAIDDRVYLDTIMLRLCEGRVAQLENIKGASESMVGISAEHTEIRRGVSLEWKDLTDVHRTNAKDINSKVQDVMGKLQAELDAPSIARGNGERMDAFVLAQDEAVTKLQEALDIAPQISLLNSEKVDRTVQSYKAGAVELKCSSCNATRDSLVKSVRSLPATVESHKAACAQYATPAAVLNQKVTLQQEMDDVDSAHKAQTKEAAARMTSLVDEKGRLDNLHRLMMR